ncbi:ATP-binding protein [soil metagenome]
MSNGADEHPPSSQPSETPSEAPPETSPQIPAEAGSWVDLANPPSSDGPHIRERLRVPSDRVTIRGEPSALPETPRESTGLFELFGPIARRALELGLAAREPSFHVFVAAAPEVMIEDDVVRYTERVLSRAGRALVAGDVVYVHDFERPEAPRPLLLPPGGARRLSDALRGAIRELEEHLRQMEEVEELKQAQAALAKEVEASNKTTLTALESTAKHLGFGVRTIHGGVQTFPILHGKPLTSEQFEALDDSTKRALHVGEARLTQEVERAAAVVRENTQRFAEARHDALSQVAHALVDASIDACLVVISYLGDDVKKFIENSRVALKEDWEDLLADDDTESKGEGEGDDDPEHARRRNRFRVNVFVARAPDAPPPVVYDTNPTYPHLFGYLERRARYGALLTDFTRIRPGSLQRASGGVLVVRAADVLADPIIWERMKRVLRERRIGAEDPLGPLGLYATSLRPVPVPIRVRVVLIGAPELSAALLDNDPDFAALFRVKVECEHYIPRTPENLIRLDGYLMGMANDREWGRFDRGARARLLDLATRLAGDQEKLALSLTPLEETAAFASALAAARATGESDVPLSLSAERSESEHEPNLHASVTPPSVAMITADDIDRAWRERRERNGSAERTFRELTLRGEVTLETTGARVGVVNGLSVLSVGDVEFGQPMRITAVVALGREGLIDVEREAQLGGSIHTKGVAILRGYLGKIFGQERPLSLRAQIAFEQSYGEIDGDSASSAELIAVISALADVPIDHSLALTGSVNQLGEMQTIGGICAKIEGFFDLCFARVLTGNQGVVMPRQNLPHLVLRDDVSAAIDEGRFHLYSVSTVEEAVEVLTGVSAGTRDASGRFPAASVFGRVERRLIEIAERLREAEGHGPRPDAERDDSGSESELSEGSDFRVR